MSSNSNRVQRVQELRRSNAATPQQDRRTGRDRSRNAQKRNALRDQLK